VTSSCGPSSMLSGWDTATWGPSTSCSPRSAPASRPARSCARTASLRNSSRRGSSGWARGPACSAAWTRTRWPRSGSTWTRCGPGSRPRSGRRRSPAPPGRRTVTRAGGRARGRPGWCASGAVGAGPGGPRFPRTGSPAARGDRPVLRAGSAAQRAHPVHPGHQEDPRGHPARGGRQARLANRGRAHCARPYHDQAGGPRAPDPVRGGCPGGGAARRDPRPVPAGELTGYRDG